MTEPQNQGQPVPEGEPTPEPKSEETEPLFVARNQKDLDKKFAAEKRDAVQARDRRLLEQSGAESVDDLLAAYEAQKTLDAELATETDKEREARQKVEKERDTVKQELESAYARIAEMAQEQALRAALAEAEIKPQRLSRALDNINPDDLDVDDEGNVTGAKDAVKALQEDIPEWFGSDEQPAGSRASSRPAAGPTNQQIDKEAQQAEKSRTVSAL